MHLQEEGSKIDMVDDLSYGTHLASSEWGCTFSTVEGKKIKNNIFVCHVDVSDISKIANELSRSVMDSAWVMDIDKFARRSYEQTVQDTTSCLVEVFQSQLAAVSGVSGEFGEIMVSMGASQALTNLFNHISLPISELWKPQKKQNEGFDFHTLCPKKVINFGEAKFSSSINPHSVASSQANGFFSDEKHYRDRVHLINIAKDGIPQLDNERFGAVIAFTINSEHPLTIFRNAITTALTHPQLVKAENIYIVGVSS